MGIDKFNEITNWEELFVTVFANSFSVTVVP